VSRGRPPLIGVDARKLRDFGIGSHIRSLLGAMGETPDSERFRFRIYVRREDREVLPVLPAHFEAVDESARGYSLAEMTGFAWRLFRDRLDLFHATHYVLPPLLQSRAVVTIHDIIHLLYPQFLPSRAAHVYARFMIHRALTRADRIITVSYNSKRDLIDYFGIPGGRTEVIYNGVSSRFRADLPVAERNRVREKLGLTGPYMLFLGGEKPHKNVQNVVRAFAEARRRTSLPHSLVLAGPMPKNEGRLWNLISALDLGPSIVKTGIVAEEDLPPLYAGAQAFLYPTLYEGFGLPVIEAMACGTPVLTSSTSALQEIAGGYAYLVDPMDVDAIAAGIVVLATDEKVRNDFCELGKKRALDFSWSKAAEKTLAVYASALGGPRKS
jgi:glycosyltransferase involved in cell wall biosynthesis